MSIRRTINPSLQTNNDTGFSEKAKNQAGRFVNKDGSFNVIKVGMPIWKRVSIFHFMLNMPRWKFALTILFSYLTINILFSAVYFLIGESGLEGIAYQTAWGRIKETFYFSCETFTTVGYGRVNPVGDAANLVAALEAMTGFLSFAIATGLMYGRFSKAKAHVVFSHHAIVAPYKDMTGLMFRLTTYKEAHTLSSVTIRVTASLIVLENEVPTYKFYELELERTRIDSLMMNWTVVHPIDENSPLIDMTAEDMAAADLEVYVYLNGYDDVYGSSVLKRTSYTFEEIVHGVKFAPMHRESEDGNATIVDLNKLGNYVKV